MRASGRWAACPLALCAVALLSACTPALDWREFRPPDGGGLQLLMPCRASPQQRAGLLAGQAVRLSLSACDAGARSWAVVSLDVGDPALVPAALLALRAAAASNIGATAPDWLPLTVPGATPQPAAGRAHLSGRRPDGSPVAVDTAVFSRGTVLLQVSVLGGSSAPVDAQTFFESMRFRP